MEGCSKSHFSYTRNEVEKVTPRHLILERFLEPKSTQDRKKWHSKSLQKSTRFLIRFFIDFGSILDPTGRPKVQHFSSFFALGATLGPSWRQEGTQSGPRQLQSSIFHEICTLWHQFSKIFVRLRSFILIQFPAWLPTSLLQFATLFSSSRHLFRYLVCGWVS